MVSRERPEGSISELARFQGPNMVSCNIFSGNQRTPIVGIYLPPSTLDHLPDLEEVINRFLGRGPFVLVCLNADIARLSNPHYQQVSDFLASLQLVDLLGHFCQSICYFCL